MGFRFRKSIKIAPGVRVNVSKKGVGVSLGGNGLTYSANSRGQSRVTASIPGTGLSYSKSLSGGSNKSKGNQYYGELASDYSTTQLDKEEQLELNRLEVELFDQRLFRIKFLHIDADPPIDWGEVENSSPPFPLGEIGPKEREARDELEAYKPGFFEKLFGKNQEKLAELEQGITLAAQQDQEDYGQWEELVSLAKGINQQEQDSYLEAIERFCPLDDLLEFGSGFEFFLEDEHYIEIEFDINLDQVVPKEVKSLTKTGKVSTKAMGKGKYFDIQQDYVCSCIIRIARDMFALLPIDYVVMHALDQRLNTATGNREQIVVVSIRIDRETLSQLNLELIDPSEAMTNFQHNMKFKKLSGFEPVERFNW